MAKRTKETIEEKAEFIEIRELDTAEIELCMIGTTPLVLNRMSMKAMQELLLPRKKRNAAELELSQKHDPPEEFRSSIYRCRNPKAPTLLHIPNGALKKALAQAALDIPGATKAQIGRLVSIIDETVHLWGIPFLHMTPVRMAGPSRAPDIRTRAILPKWALRCHVRYVRNFIRERDIANLSAAAGKTIGIGDGRTEKGTFDMGAWKIVSSSDREFKAIIAAGARKSQEKAMANPQCFDGDTEELLAWFNSEIIRRERDRKGNDVLSANTNVVRINGRGRARKGAAGQPVFA